MFCRTDTGKRLAAAVLARLKSKALLTAPGDPQSYSNSRTSSQRQCFRMWHLPRIALGAVQPEARCEPLLWGLLSLCQQVGITTQTYLSRSCFSPHDGAKAVTGRASRHLDSWLMNRSGCLRALRRGAGNAELAIVQGTWAAPSSLPGNSPGRPTGSCLTTLCDWLDLPRIGVVDAAQLRTCALPQPGTKLDALFIDNAVDHPEAIRWQTELESLWGVPVVGWLDQAESLRSALGKLPAGVDPPKELCQALGQRLAGKVRLDRLLNLAARPPLPEVLANLPFQCTSRRKLQVAVALDEDFSCHFPDTLDSLESVGAVIRDFSPLRNESLPEHVDLVIIGCGHPERHLETLAANHCLKQSLRCFAAAGGRIYAEGGGLAYLCRQMILADGRSAPMTGLLPATARQVLKSGEPEPAEITFGSNCWMADAATQFRGYRVNQWQIEPTGPMLSLAQEPRYRCDLLGRGNIVGSRVLTNFAAQPHLLRRFFYPYMPVALALRS